MAGTILFHKLPKGQAKETTDPPANKVIPQNVQQLIRHDEPHQTEHAGKTFRPLSLLERAILIVQRYL